jgi:putative ABC transport system permease protein
MALLLALAGIYALMSFTVTRRTREIGVRVALGAGRRQVLATVLGRAARHTPAGAALGALLAQVSLRVKGCW